jgi:hypothetical protein
LERRRLCRTHGTFIPAAILSWEPRSAMVPPIIALSRARHLWTRGASHWRELSKLRSGSRVAKILLRRFRRRRWSRSRGWPLRKKVPSQRSAISEIRESPLRWTTEIPAIPRWLRPEVTSGPIWKSRSGGPRFTRRAFAHVPSRCDISRAGIRSKTITPEVGTPIAIGAKITREFPM